MNELTDLMERATRDIRPDVASLVAGGIGRGHRRRMRRRLGAGAAGALGAAGAMAAAVLVMPSTSAPHGTVLPGASVTVAAPTSSPERQLPTRKALVTGQVVDLPAGKAELLRSSGDATSVSASWAFTPKAGGGAGYLYLSIEKVELPPSTSGAPVSPETLSRVDRFKVGKGRMPAGNGPEPTGPPMPYSARAACDYGPELCKVQPDGTVLASFGGPEPRYEEIIGAYANLWTLDGFRISATSYNAMGEKGVEPTRTEPALSQAQLTELVRSASW